jgi:hypothetical protein
LNASKEDVVQLQNSQQRCIETFDENLIIERRLEVMPEKYEYILSEIEKYAATGDFNAINHKQIFISIATLTPQKRQEYTIKFISNKNEALDKITELEKTNLHSPEEIKNARRNICDGYDYVIDKFKNYSGDSF